MNVCAVPLVSSSETTTLMVVHQAKEKFFEVNFSCDQYVIVTLALMQQTDFALCLEHLSFFKSL
jgi:hypothetical protein